MALLPNDVEGQALSGPEYWDDRFTNSISHEWLKTFAALEPFFSSHLFPLPRSSRILHLGSGNSTVPAELAQRGFRNQLCVDFSHVTVSAMATAEAKQQGIEWEQADIRDMPSIPTSSVDVCFDKSTLDAMVYGSPWNPLDHVKDSAQRYMAEVHRVLRNDGVFFLVSFRQPHFVKPLINSDSKWKIEVEILSEGESSFGYFCFILKKA